MALKHFDTLYKFLENTQYRSLSEPGAIRCFMRHHLTAIIDKLLTATVIDVWSNGNAVRKYQGQDKQGRYVWKTSPKNGYQRYVAILIPYAPPVERR